MSDDPKQQRFRAVTAALALTEHDAIDLVADALALHAANTNTPDKVLARRLDANVASLRNWKQRKCAPTLHHFFAMARAIPELRAEVARVLEMEREIDPETERAISALVQAQMRRGT